METTSRSTPSEDVVSPSSLGTTANRRNPQSGGEFPIPNAACNPNSENSCSPSDSNMAYVSHGEGSNQGSAQKCPNLFDFDEMQVADKRSKSPTDEVDVFSMNLDSSPSECLGKLHISSNEYQQSVSPLTPKSSAILPHPSLSFDNMEDLDLCSLLFDVS